MTERPITPTTYLLAYAALVGLTVLTVFLSFLHLSPWHLAVGSAIGATKAFLVALFFMHLVRSPSRTWLAAGVGLFWLGILLCLTFSDYLTRRTAAY